MKKDKLPSDRDEVLNTVAKYLAGEHGIVQVSVLGFENTYALAMREHKAASLGIRRISDLTFHAPRLSIGGDYEFFGRPEWRDIEKTYGLRFGTKRSMDSSLMYQAVANGSVDVISAFSTDGRITAFDLRVLEDDRGTIPPYDAVVLVSPHLMRKQPAVAEALRRLGGTIDADRMRRMNLEVDEFGKSPAVVASRFIGDLDLQSSQPSP